MSVSSWAHPVGLNSDIRHSCTNTDPMIASDIAPNHSLTNLVTASSSLPSLLSLLSSDIDEREPKIFSALTIAVIHDDLLQICSTSSLSFKLRTCFSFIHPLDAAAMVYASSINANKSGKASVEAKVSSSWTNDNMCSPTCVIDGCGNKFSSITAFDLSPDAQISSLERSDNTLSGIEVHRSNNNDPADDFNFDNGNDTEEKIFWVIIVCDDDAINLRISDVALGSLDNK